MNSEGYSIKTLRSSCPLSKSRFVHGMQCPLYLWLEVRTDAPRLEPDCFTQALFQTGRDVGVRARERWDRRLEARGQAPGVLVTDDPERHAEAVVTTAEALADGASVIHEAAFTHGGVKAKVDVLERLGDGSFAINEVKSTAHYDQAKHLLDAAVQLWVLQGSGLDVSVVRLVHLNNAYEWSGGEYDLEQLFVEADVTEPAKALQDSIGIDVSRLLRVVSSDNEPVVPEGTSCSKPYGCPYLEICPALGDPIEHPISELPGRTDAVCRRAKQHGYASLLDLDEHAARLVLTYADGRPHDGWFTTWKATVTGERILLPECPAWIGQLEYPIRHLDFETVGAPLPIVTNTRPFEAVPLQYSIHAEAADGAIEHRDFLVEADDPNPRRTLIERMLSDLGETGAILHWSAYEKTVISKLADNPHYAEYRERLLALLPRLRDLGNAVNHWVFDKDFHGRWSIKKVYPALVPGADPESIREESEGVLSYDDLDGVAKGDEAALMLLEYLQPETADERRQEIRRQLLQYCKLDTWATVEVLRVLREECGGEEGLAS